MSGTFMDQLEYITVAVAFDKHSLALTQAAADLCSRTGKKLCLLHVVEPWAEMPHSRPYGEGDPLWDVTQAVESNSRDLALGRLEELISGVITPGQVVKKAVVSGKPVECIGREALAAGSCLLLVGADFGNLRFMPRGLSTALSLMVTSPVPVCVVDTSLTPRLFKEPARLLLADDLGQQSETAVEFAFGLGTALAPAELHHIHVNGLTLGSLESGLATAAAASHTPMDTGGSAIEVYDALLAGFKERLEARASTQREYFDAAGGTYLPEVATGNISEQLAEVAGAVNADALIFGRHHAYYTKPFFIGRVPYRAMLALRRPIIVVPNE